MYKYANHTGHQTVEAGSLSQVVFAPILYESQIMCFDMFIGYVIEMLFVWLFLLYSSNLGLVSLFLGLLCRLVYPPVNPIGGSDLFPGPGAGMYPTRSVDISDSWFSIAVLEPSTFLLTSVSIICFNSFRSDFGSGSMLLGLYYQSCFELFSK